MEKALHYTVWKNYSDKVALVVQTRPCIYGLTEPVTRLYREFLNKQSNLKTAYLMF